MRWAGEGLGELDSPQSEAVSCLQGGGGLPAAGGCNANTMRM